MSAPVSTLVEIGELMRTRPTVDTPPAVVGAWYERKAVVLHHIAAETGDNEAERWSRLAHGHATRLLGHNHTDSPGLADDNVAERGVW